MVERDRCVSGSKPRLNTKLKTIVSQDQKHSANLCRLFCCLSALNSERGMSGGLVGRKTWHARSTGLGRVEPWGSYRLWKHGTGNIQILLM